MYNEIIRTIFAIPTPVEIIAAVVVGLAFGIVFGYYIDMNGIKSFKDFKEFFIKNLKDKK